MENFSWTRGPCYNDGVWKVGSSFVATDIVQNPGPRVMALRSPQFVKRRQTVEWIRRKWAKEGSVDATREIFRDLRLHTVCESARCPNRGECWQRRTITFMVLGDVCTRNCSFCAVAKGAPMAVDSGEPWNVARAVRLLDLANAVITSVTRDDLPDGGAAHVAATIAAIRSLCPGARVEALAPDFRGDPAAIEAVLAAGPDVFGHNIEMAARLYPLFRSERHCYWRSLAVLRKAAGHAARNAGRPVVKSALMVGLGETDDEVESALKHLREAGCVAVSIGQYLRPTRQQREVVRFIAPDQFRTYERVAYELGFAYAAAGPFVRSSYRSDELWKALENRL